jgi:DNA repair protein RAD7
LIRRRGQQQQQQQAEAGPSNASAGGNQDPNNVAEQNGGPSAPTGDVCISVTYTSEPRLRLDIEVAPDSDHLDSEDEVPTGRKRKVSKAALEKQKMAAKKRAKKNKDDDDDDYEDSEDEYTALSKSFWTSKPGNAKPSVGSLEKCAKCSKQFTVVRSSMVVWRVSCL